MTQDKDDDFDLDIELEDEFLDEITEDDFDSGDDVLDDSDDDIAFGSDDFEDDLGWDYEDDGAAATGSTALGEQKKSALSNFNLSFNAIVIGIALIVGVFVFGFQVMTKKPQQVAERFISSLNMNGASDGPVFGSTEEDASVEEEVKQNSRKENAFLFNADVLDETDSNSIEVEKVEESVEGNKIQETALTPLPKAVVEKIDELQTPRSPTILTEMPESKVVLEIEEFDKQPDKKNQNIDIISLTEDKNIVEESVELAKTKEEISIDEAFNQIEDTAAQFVEEKVQAEKETISKSENPDARDTQGVQSAINALNERLNDMEGRLAQVRDGGNAQIQDISESVQVLQKKIKASSSVNSAKATSSTSSKAIVSKENPKRVVKKSKPTSSVVWELRAAQPDKAWVSKKGQSSIQPIVVGDVLSGMGRITSISYDNGRWTVRAEKGVIRQ